MDSVVVVRSFGIYGKLHSREGLKRRLKIAQLFWRSVSCEMIFRKHFLSTSLTNGRASVMAE